MLELATKRSSWQGSCFFCAKEQAKTICFKPAAIRSSVGVQNSEARLWASHPTGTPSPRLHRRPTFDGAGVLHLCLLLSGLPHICLQQVPHHSVRQLSARMPRPSVEVQNNLVFSSSGILNPVFSKLEAMAEARASSFRRCKTNVL